MNKKEDLLRKIKTMNLEDLETYRTAAKGANRMIDILGVGLILTLLIFTMPLMFIPGGIVLYIISHMGANLGETISAIEERIAFLSDRQINS